VDEFNNVYLKVIQALVIGELHKKLWISISNDVATSKLCAFIDSFSTASVESA
jgi:hypothetical protein